MKRSLDTSLALALFPLAALAFAACSDDDPAAPAQPSAGASSKGGAAGKAGTAGGAGTAGKGGSTAGAGGANAGAGGSAGSTGGAAGVSAGSGGATAGSAGTTAGSAGASAGSAGASAGSAGASAGSAGASAGSAGASAGSAGAAGAGAGGAAGGGGIAGASGAGAGGAAGIAGQGGGAGTGGAGAGGAAGIAGAAGAAGAGGASAVVTCGTEPYQRLKLFAGILNDVPPTSVFVEGSICTGKTVEIPFKGEAAYDVQRNTPYHLIGRQAGNLTAFTIENNIKLAAFPVIGAGFSMVSPGYPTIVNPGWNPAKMGMFRMSISSTKSGATAPCNDKAGVTFSVPNHPEALFQYGGNAINTSTGSGGDANAWIMIETTGTEAAPEFVTVTATKASCKVGLEASNGFFITGRIPVAINVVTSELAYEIANPLPSLLPRPLPGIGKKKATTPAHPVVGTVLIRRRSSR